MENQPNKTFEITDDLLATSGQRLGNYFIDLIMVYAIIFVIGVIAAILASLFDSASMLEWLTESNTLRDYLILFSVWIPYYTFFEAFNGRTVGKLATKTMVVYEDGSPIDLGTALKRTLCRIIPFEAFSFLGGSTRGWHDSIPDTYVVQKEAFIEKRNLFEEFEQIGNQSEEVYS